jgi:predicted unusual protein kinase regulating ubiquinone biosynthesis (AarF/ABC1/UbiB family)
MIKLVKLIKDVLLDGIKYIVNIQNYDDTVISILKHVSEYNIIFVKIYQWTRIKNDINENDSITEKISEEIYKYANKTFYKEEDIDYKSLLNIYETANKLGDKFEFYDLKPINSGTISLIFKGKLNGKDVIIKLLRKNIKKELENGLNILINIENVLYNLPIIRKYYNLKMFDENMEVILNQTNFMNEVENLKLFYKSFKDVDNIITPNVYEEYTKNNENLIVMEYIDGKYLYELDREELDKYFNNFILFIIKSLFTYNIFHSDLHQGNILFINYNKRYKIGIIDMGMVIILNNNELDFAYLFLTVIYNNNFMEFLEYIDIDINRNIMFKNSLNIDKCILYLKKLYNNNEIFYDPNTKVIISDINKLLQILKKFNCILYHRYKFIILSMIPIFGIIDKLGPGIIKKDIVKNIMNNMVNY